MTGEGRRLGTGVLTALLAALAVAVALLGPAPPKRLARVLPHAPSGRTAAGKRPGSVPAPRLACGLAGVAIWWLFGGAGGLVAGAALAVMGPRMMDRLDRGVADAEQVAAELPFVLDLLAACLAGGATTAASVTAVAAAVPGPCALRLQRVAAALAVGSTPAEAWRSLGADRGPAGSAARALARAAEGGAPVAKAVQRVAEDARREAGARAERAARRAGVLAVGPLGLCFLPAFLLLGVVPAVVGLAGPLLGSL